MSGHNVLLSSAVEYDGDFADVKVPSGILIVEEVTMVN